MKPQIIAEMEKCILAGDWAVFEALFSPDAFICVGVIGWLSPADLAGVSNAMDTPISVRFTIDDVRAINEVMLIKGGVLSARQSGTVSDSDFSMVVAGGKIVQYHISQQPGKQVTNQFPIIGQIIKVHEERNGDGPYFYCVLAKTHQGEFEIHSRLPIAVRESIGRTALFIGCYPVIIRRRNRQKFQRIHAESVYILNKKT